MFLKGFFERVGKTLPHTSTSHIRAFLRNHCTDTDHDSDQDIGMDCLVLLYMLDESDVSYNKSDLEIFGKRKHTVS